MTPEELAHQQRVAGYLAKIKRLWQQATDEAAAMAGKVIGYDPTKPFNIINYPQTSKEMNKIISELHDQTQFLIEEGIDLEWYHANKNNDKLVKNWSKNKPRPPEQWMQHNEDARDAFKIRKQAGMNLSDRVWRITNEHKVNLEMAIDMSLYDGKSAQLLSQDIRNYLNEPNRLYRRVRDARGNLHLSKAAQGYHSGQGVYRSSYKNAMRVARTEHNLAYRYSDFYRTVQLDFVVGFEVHLSNNHTINGVPFVDVCDELKGKYPKGFKFGGWHPQCRCYVTNILMDEDEFNMIEDRMLAGEDISNYVSPNTIWDTPRGFNNWVQQNMKRSEGWKSQPYWVKDNFRGETLRGGLQIGKSLPPKVLPPTPPPVPKPPVPAPPPVPEPPPVQIPSYFNPAISEQEAVEWGKKYLGIEYEGEFNLDQLNAINRGHWRVRKSLSSDIELEIKKYKALSSQDMKYIMSRREGDTLLLNKSNFNDKTILDHYRGSQIAKAESTITELKAKLQQFQYANSAEKAQIEAQIRSWEMTMEEWKARPSFIAGNSEEYVIGELGKDIRGKLSKYGYDVELEQKLSLVAADEGLMISEYATTGGLAYTEEAWVAYMRGEFYKINPELRAVFDKAVKFKPIEVKAPLPKPKPKPEPLPEPPPPPAPKSKDFEWQNSVKDAQKWAEDNGLAEGVWYDGMTVEEANEVNRTLWKLQKDAPMKFKAIRSIDQDGLYNEIDTIGFEDGSKLLINIREVRKAFAARKNLHDKIKQEISDLEKRVEEFRKYRMRKYITSYNAKIEQLKNALNSTPEWNLAADMEMDYLKRLSDVVTGGRMQILESSVKAADMRLMEKASNRMAEALKDRNYRMQYTVRAFQSSTEFLKESYILYKKGMLKDPYTKELIEEFIDISNGRVHIPSKIAPPPVAKKPWDASKSIHDQLASLKTEDEFKQWADEVLNCDDTWGDLKADVRRQIYEEFHALRSEYGFKRRITFGWENRKSAYASAGERSYNIKKSWWIEKDKLEKQFANDIEQGWHHSTEVGARRAINRHEFGHVLTSKTLHFSTIPEFNTKLREIRKRYYDYRDKMLKPLKDELEVVRKERSKLSDEKWTLRDKLRSGEIKTEEELQKIAAELDIKIKLLDWDVKRLQHSIEAPSGDWYISGYAEYENNINEFAAEGFCTGMEPNNKNPFAKEILELIKEYFKGTL